MDKKLFKTREDIYKKCPSVFWEVSIFCFIFGIALIALDTVLLGFVVLTISVFFMPLLYATFMTLYTIKFGGTVTFKSTFNIAMSYFRRNSFGCFRLTRCLFHALLAYLISSFFIYIILRYAFEGFYGDVFLESYNHMMELSYAGDMEGVLTYLSEDNPAALYMEFSTVFSISCGVVAFMFGVAFNSLNVYLCANIPQATAQFSTAVFTKFLKTKINSYRKDFWSLNWPFFLLLIVGIVGGHILTISIDIPLSYALPISTMMGILCMIPFAPFFFAGMEALFAKYNGDLKQASIDLTNGFLDELKNSVNLSEEDKKKLDELLSKKNLFDEATKEADPTDDSNKEENTDSDDSQNDNPFSQGDDFNEKE